MRWKSHVRLVGGENPQGSTYSNQGNCWLEILSNQQFATSTYFSSEKKGLNICENIGMNKLYAGISYLIY